MLKPFWHNFVLKEKKLLLNLTEEPSEKKGGGDSDERKPGRRGSLILPKLFSSLALYADSTIWHFKKRVGPWGRSSRNQPIQYTQKGMSDARLYENQYSLQV